uniref:Elicitin n=1 Tax=Albugo laibachii Nc14 TaxID=890382 RepID=F0W6S8_9STRA|nr:elicitinlike protein SOL7 putative [Albugo laibachii Nc14]|eukprot:CCA16823.1 elicitinlike protein SOL7 putative [Albugo laibachii Nc14]
MWLLWTTSLQLILAVSADHCPSSEVVKLASAASNPNVSSCMEASGSSFIPHGGWPKPDKLLKMCGSTACRSLFQEIDKLEPMDCIIAIDSIELNMKQIVDNFHSGCNRLGEKVRKAFEHRMTENLYVNATSVQMERMNMTDSSGEPEEKVGLMLYPRHSEMLYLSN